MACARTALPRPTATCARRRSTPAPTRSSATSPPGACSASTMTLDAPASLAFVAPDEYPMIREAADRLLDDHAAAAVEDWPAIHAALAEAGLLAAPMRDVDGAMDDARVVALVAESIGERGLVSPFVVSCAVAGRALERAGRRAASDAGARIARAELIATVAWYEDDGLLLGAAPSARLRHVADGLVLDARKRAVPFGAQAGLL